MPLPQNFTFYITGRSELEYFADKQINYFIGFNHPNWDEPYTPESVFEHLGYIEKFSTITVHDAYTEEHRRMGLKMPNEGMIAGIIMDAKEIKELLDKGEQVNLLCGCAAGISRSTAACYIILCYLLGEWNEREAFNLLVNKRMIAYPNPLMVKLADDMLKRGFKMVSSLKNYLDLEPERTMMCYYFRYKELK